MSHTAVLSMILDDDVNQCTRDLHRYFRHDYLHSIMFVPLLTFRYMQVCDMQHILNIAPDKA